MKLDICIPYLRNYSHELEWSIKSLKNTEHGDVYVLGQAPDYAIDAKVITPQAPPMWARISPYNDVIHKILTYAEKHDGDFLLMNDDIFLMDKYDGTVHHRGLLSDRTQGNLTTYLQGLKNTEDWLVQNGYTIKDYDCHTPMIMNSRKFIDLVQRILPQLNMGHNLMIRSLYGNVYGVKSKKIDKDPKNQPNYQGMDIISTTEETFNGEMGLYIRTILSGGKVDVKSKKLNIAANIHYYIEEHGSGGEHYMHRLLKELAKKHNVTAFIADDNLKNTTIDGVKVNYTDDIRTHNFDLIITHFQKTYESLQIARQRNIPIVTVVHNNMPQTKQSLTMQPPKRLVIYNSEWIKKDIGFNGLVLTPPIKTVKKLKGVKQEKILLVNLIPEKGSDLFFELAKELPQFKFLGVKGGYYKSKQQDISLPNLEIIENTNDMDSVYSQTKIVLMPSSYESYGMVAAEAAQIGIPTIAHNTPGLVENLGSAGILINRNNIEAYKSEIIKLMTDKAYYKEMSTKAKERSKERKASNQIKEVVKAIEEL